MSTESPKQVEWEVTVTVRELGTGRGSTTTMHRVTSLTIESDPIMNGERLVGVDYALRCIQRPGRPGTNGEGLMATMLTNEGRQP